MNLHTAITLCRTARRQGKISAEVQQRTLRRLIKGQPGMEMEVITMDRWGSLMALRREIEREIMPKLKVLRSSRFELLHSRDDQPKAAGRQSWGTPKTKLPKLDPELTPEWWRAAGKREREAAKLAKA